MIQSRPTRRAVQTFLGAMLAMSLAAPAMAQSARDPGAEQFIQTKAQGLVTILAGTGAPAQKRAAFHTAIDQVTDVPKITNFVLGKYARTATSAQKERFAAAFRVYAEKVYQDRISDYHGQGLQVTGSVVRKPGDVIVNSLVRGGQITQPLPVSWRVLGDGAGWRVVDVQVKGVWLAITQQQDFVSTIDNAGGNVDVLIAQLQHDAERPQLRN